MERNEKETHDFMNVEYFSQLPFSRPTPAKEKGIRLFGKDFGGGTNGGTTTGAAIGSVPQDRSPSEENSQKECENGDSNRKFECHYCFRNFPTSQALGGHQNAHKRERQQAKRAHLQSSAAMAHGSYYPAYHRFGAAPPPPSLVPPLSYHHSWNENSTNTSAYVTTNPRFYGNTHHLPINGNPLGLWRIPTVQNPAVINHERSMHHHPLPLFAGHEVKHTSSMVGGANNSQNRFIYEGKPSIQDQVSLDLHL